MPDPAGDRPPKAPRADALRNRARVLEAARDAFGAQGAAVSLDDIARSAGVGAGTVYRHFATKQALFEAVVADRLAALIEQGRALGDAADPGAALFSYLVTLGREGALKRDLVEALAPTGARLPFAGTPAAGDLFAVLADLLRRAQSAGAVRTDIDVEDVVAVLTGTAVAISRAGADEARSETLLRIMCDGLRATAP